MVRLNVVDVTPQYGPNVVDQLRYHYHLVIQVMAQYFAAGKVSWL